MTKYDLAKEIHEKTGLSMVEASQALEEVIALLKETLSEGETVKLSGFGTFLVKKRSERKGRNLQTGKEIPVCRLAGRLSLNRACNLRQW